MNRKQKIRSWLVLAVLFGSVMGFNNCGEFKTGASLISSGATSLSSEASPELISGKALYQANCATCHGPLDSSAKLGKGYGAIDNAIQTIPQMAHLKFLVASDIDALAIALNAPVGAIDSSIATTFRPPVSNRYLLASQLQTLFVASSGADSSDTKIQGYIDSFVVGHPEAFGGNCSRNDPGCVPKPCAWDGACSGQLDASRIAEPDPTVGTTRKGYSIQVCEQILEVDKSVQTLLTGAGLNASTAPTATDVETLLAYVFPGQEVNGSIKTMLMNVATASKTAGLSSLDQWRYMIVPVCQSTTFDLL